MQFLLALFFVMNAPGHAPRSLPPIQDALHVKYGYAYGKLVVAKRKWGEKGDALTSVVLLDRGKFDKLTLCDDVTARFSGLTGKAVLLAYERQISDVREPCHELIALVAPQTSPQEQSMIYELENPNDWPDNMRAWTEKHQPVFMVLRKEDDKTTHVAGADTEAEAMELAMMWSASGNGKQGYVEVLQREASEA